MTRLLLTVFFAAAAVAAQAGPIIVVPNGAVQVRMAGGEWHALPSNGLVAPGQEVRTDGRSTAELRFSDGSRVQLAPETVFAIQKMDTQESSFSLSYGKIRAAFAGLLSSRVAIRTPSSVCAVRGTVFEIGVDDKNTDVTMAEGVLEVKDNQGHEAVVTSEETIRIGDSGMERPHFVALGGDHALPAVRPYQVHQEMARDATRKMLEDVRTRELKANEAQLGKDAIDAFGRRVRIEEYLLRPADNSFEVLFLSHRTDRFDWGHLIETFHTTIPDDVSQTAAIIDATYFSKTLPTNYLTGMEFFATNTIDSIKENLVLGAPTLVDFSGYGPGIGSLYYPSSMLFTQVLTSPGMAGVTAAGIGGVGFGTSADGVPVGPDGRLQFSESQSYDSLNHLFTFSQSFPDGNPGPGFGFLTPVITETIDPTLSPGSPGAVQGPNPVGNYAIGSYLNPLITVGGGAAYDGAGSLVFAGDANYNYILGNSFTLTPSGPDKADLLAVTLYPDGTAVSSEKFLVSNDGKLFDFANPDPNAFAKNGSYNLEFNIGSNIFEGRDIDVMIAPEILSALSQGTQGASKLQP